VRRRLDFGTIFGDDTGLRWRSFLQRDIFPLWLGIRFGGFTEYTSSNIEFGSIEEG
jgi:hypothetical protein